MQLQNEVLKTLLYYDIWSYPLTAKELFAFLPVNSMTFEQFSGGLREELLGEEIKEHEGFFFVRGKSTAIVADRGKRQRHAKWMWIMARMFTHLIKRFPFVRGVFVSGDLSKNATNRKSDIDFFVLTEPQRLWIARSLLILFKKVFLFNRKKYLCLNSFITTNNLIVNEKNIFIATEIATLKPLFNTSIFQRYLEANDWIKEYFPNFDVQLLELPKANNRRSVLQKILELPFSFLDAAKLDKRLMVMMENVWERRYPDIDAETRSRIFKCTSEESRAYVGDFEGKILELYKKRLTSFGVAT